MAYSTRRFHVWAQDKVNTLPSVCSPHTSPFFHNPCHPKPYFVLKRPWQCSQSSLSRDAIVAECVRMIFFFFFLQRCVLLCSNGLCVSGPKVTIILETGSWQGTDVDVWVGVQMGLDPFHRPSSLIEWDRHNNPLLRERTHLCYICIFNALHELYMLFNLARQMHPEVSSLKSHTWIQLWAVRRVFCKTPIQNISSQSSITSF